MGKKVVKLMIVGAIAIAGFTGCAPKTNIKALKAGKVSDTSVKSIAVLEFKNDNIGQSDLISTRLSNYKLDGKNYFKVANRANIDAVLNEKKLNDSGLVDIDDSRSKGLSQVKTLMTGRVLDVGSSVSGYYKTVKSRRCAQYRRDKRGRTYCTRYHTRQIRCEARNYTVQTNIKVIKVSTSRLLYTKNYTASEKKSRCQNDSTVLPTKYQIAPKLADNIAAQIIADIAPSYQSFNVELLDDPDIKYNSKQETMLETSIELIEKNRTKDAATMLQKLNRSTGSSSYVALYNYGVAQEANGKLEHALKLFKQANNIALKKGEVVDEIPKAINRVSANIIEQKKASGQIKGK